jgi:DNA-binding transcriptional LysR family regulator
MLNAHQLNVYLVAAETLNFTQAAQILQMTQPSVSQHIQALEEHFGVELFIRSGRSLELTDAGKELIPLAREFIYLSTHIEEMMASIKGDVCGHLQLSCSTTVGRYILPNILSAFSKSYPQVRSTCQITSQSRALQLLCEGKVHLAMTSSPEMIKDAEYRHLVTDQILLITHSDHPWAKSGVIDPTELYKAVFVLPEERSECHRAVQEALSGIGVSIYQLNSPIILGNAESIALAVQQGLGVGFVPRIVVEKLILDKVVPVLISGVTITQDIYLARNILRPPTSAQEAFWRFIFEDQWSNQERPGTDSGR